MKKGNYEYADDIRHGKGDYNNDDLMLDLMNKKEKQVLNKSEIEKTLGIKLDESNFKTITNDRELEIYNSYEELFNESTHNPYKNKPSDSVYKKFDLGKVSNYDRKSRNFVNFTIDPQEFDKDDFSKKMLALNDDDFNNFIKSDYGKFFMALSKDQIEACIFYTGFDYKIINSTLREGKFDDFVDEQVKFIDGAINKYGGLKEDTTLYRVLDFTKSEGGNTILDKLMAKIDPGNIEQVYSVFDSLKGHSIVDHGYMSSSITKGGTMKGNIHMELSAPKGTAGMDISILSPNVGEEEFLLARDTKLTVDDVSIKGAGKDKYVDVKCSVINDFEYEKVYDDEPLINDLISDAGSVAKRYEVTYDELSKNELKDLDLPYIPEEKSNKLRETAKKYGRYKTVLDRMNLLKKIKEAIEFGK
ncbi:MAG: ADP-ribosyltransferase [Bacilli bacterium]|nr:ADP-ribosyltransferase [Bacilli bacterium]